MTHSNDLSYSRMTKSKEPVDSTDNDIKFINVESPHSISRVKSAKTTKTMQAEEIVSI